MKKFYYFSFLLLGCNLLDLVLSQTLLGSCDYTKYPSNGCEDELGSDCDTNQMMCKCKSGNWVVIDNKFCFPTKCSTDEYYDHNLGKCEPKRKSNLNSEENYCRYDFHCRGDNTHCQQYGWNYRCVCNRGFIYDTSTQQCQKLKGLNGYCQTDIDCDTNSLRQLVCFENACQCAHGFTYNYVIDGCEDNQRIADRDKQTRSLIFLFIIMGLFFGAALSMSFGYSSQSSRQLLLKRIVASHNQQNSSQSESNTNDRTVNLINNRETA